MQTTSQNINLVARDQRTDQRYGRTMQDMLQTPTATLIPTRLPKRPCKQIGTELLEQNKTTYILIVDFAT